MNIFDVRERLVADYRGFTSAFVSPRDDRIRDFAVDLRPFAAAFGEFRTKRLILEAYDAMAEATVTGVPYVSPLDPPPGHGPRHESASGS